VTGSRRSSRPRGSTTNPLSLLDQAIAFGGGRVAESDVRAMLGFVAGDLTFDLADALAASDWARLLGEVERIAALTPDFGELLKELIALLHRLAIFQQVPATLSPDDIDRPRIEDLAARLAPEDIQLYYQVALAGQQDLPLAPDPRAGFEMVLLRALAFRPAEPARERPGQAPAQSSRQPQPGPQAQANPSQSRRNQATTSEPAPAQPAARVPARGDRPPSRAEAESRDEPAPVETAPGPALADTADWHRLVDRLGVGGIASQLAHHCSLLDWSEGRLSLALDPGAEQLRSPATEERLRAALERVLGGPLKLSLQVAAPEQETPAQRLARQREERQREAVDALDRDPVASRLRERLDAQWAPGSIEATD
jgi:DNA polymerase-3 subunit gamma/tau